MKKTVIFEFQDDFVSPEHFQYKKCDKCVFCETDAYESWCFMTGDGDDNPSENAKECPFYRGEEIVNF